MEHDGSHAGRALARPLSWASLEVRFAATVLCLLAAGAAIITGVCGLVARSYLQGQADQQLRACASRLLSHRFTASPLYGVAAGTLGAAGFSDGLSIEVRGPAGQVVMRAGFTGPPGPAIPGFPAAVAARAGQPATVAAARSGSSWRVISEPIHYRARRILFSFSPEGFYVVITSTARPGLTGTLVIGQDQRGTGQAIRRLAVTGLAVSGLVILAVTCLAVLASRAIIRPVTQAEQALTAVTAGRLSHRVPERHSGEAGRLAGSLNMMLSQLEHAFGTQAAAEAAARKSHAQLCRIITEIGQQLRMPLNILHGMAGSYQDCGQPSASQLDRMMRRVAGEAARIDALLDQAQHRARRLAAQDQAEQHRDDGPAANG